MSNRTRWTPSSSFLQTNVAVSMWRWPGFSLLSLQPFQLISVQWCSHCTKMKYSLIRPKVEGLTWAVVQVHSAHCIYPECVCWLQISGAASTTVGRTCEFTDMLVFCSSYATGQHRQEITLAALWEVCFILQFIVELHLQILYKSWVFTVTHNDWWVSYTLLNFPSQRKYCLLTFELTLTFWTNF